MSAVTLADIQAAAAAIAGAIPVTPAVPASFLSERLGCRLTLKLETLQHTGSFKERGALNKLLTLDADARRRGVVAASAGNHAQGVAHHATRLGIPATIVMPRKTPFTKIARTAGFGATVELVGDSVEEAQAHAAALSAERGLTLIHPYDDPAVIAGQGTVGLELLAAVPELDDLVVPIGGGGLIAGIAVAVRALKPAIRITGVEAALYPSMHDALKGISRVYSGATIAEGIAVQQPCLLTRAIVAERVDDILLAGEPELESAVHLLLTGQKLLAEGAGAAGLAALLTAPEQFAGRRVGVVICGGNIDPRLLASVLMRGLVREGRLVRLRVQLEDTPGTLGAVTAVIGRCGGNIVEVHHRRLLCEVPVKRADLDVVVETRDAAHVGLLQQALAAAGFPATVLTEIGG